MLRIVGMQRSSDPEKEFVLVQNQGSMRIELRGHALMFIPDVNTSGAGVRFFPLLNSERVVPGGFVLISSGHGRDGLAKTIDGSQILRLFANQSKPLWSEESGNLSILATQHTFSEGSFVTPCIQCGVSLGVAMV